MSERPSAKNRPRPKAKPGAISEFVSGGGIGTRHWIGLGFGIGWLEDKWLVQWLIRGISGLYAQVSERNPSMGHAFESDVSGDFGTHTLGSANVWIRNGWYEVSRYVSK